MNRKKISKTRYIAAFTVSTLIFLIGLYIGSSIANSKLADITYMEQELKIKIMDMELQQVLLTENPCDMEDFTSLTNELYNVENKISFMEKQVGPYDEKIQRLRHYYFILEIRHWLFFKRLREQCNRNITTVLYFYEKNDKCNSCERQGYILSYLRKKHSSMRLYSFDVDSSSFAVDTIKKRYNVTSAPTIVVNNEVYKGFQKKADLELALKQNLNKMLPVFKA